MTTTTRAGKLCLAIQTNTDGRPCAWGAAPSEEEAREIAERQWARHGEVIGVDAAGHDIRTGCCYPGEERGPITLHWVDGITEVDGQLVNADGKPLATKTQDRIRRGINRYITRGLTTRELNKDGAK